MTPWYKSWFASPNYLKVYSHRNIDDAKNLTNLILKVTKITRADKILDAACGAGRHSLLLSKSNYHVYGFDLSKTLLLEARSSFLEERIKPIFFLSDMRNVPIKEKFELVLNLFTSFGYFQTDEENFNFARNAYKLLTDGKFFVLDFLNKDHLISNLIEETSRNIGTLQINESRQIINNRIEKRIIIHSKTDTEEFVESVRLYSKDEIVKEFDRIGYILDSCFGDYSGNQFNIDSERLILFFKK